MNFKSLLYSLIVTFLLCCSLGTGLIQLSSMNKVEINKTRNYSNDTVFHSKRQKICYSALLNSTLKHNDTKIANIDYINDWNINEDLFFMYNTRDLLHHTDYQKHYNSSIVEIWQNKDCYIHKHFILREQIIKLTKKNKPCPKEPDYIYQTRIYCNIKKYFSEVFLNGKITNCFSEFTRISNLFFLAEKKNINVVTRLVLLCSKDPDFESFDLSVVRIPGKRNNPLYNTISTKNFTKMDFVHEIFSDVTDQIDLFRYKKYQCDISFAIQENSDDDSYIDSLHKTYSTLEKNENLSSESNVVVIISKNEILQDVNATNYFLLEYHNITNAVDFAKALDDGNFTEIENATELIGDSYVKEKYFFNNLTNYFFPTRERDTI